MDYKVFQQGLDTIADTYVSKKFYLNEKQATQWYKLLKGLNNETYLDSVDDWCSTKNTIPSPSDIIEVGNRMRNIDNAIHIPKNKEVCNICKDAGVISGKYFNKQMNTTYEYVACCICEAGEYCHSIYQLPQIDRNKLNLIPQAAKGEKVNIDKVIESLSIQMSFT